MERTELVKYILDSAIFKKWHWFSYHFGFLHWEFEHPFVASVLDALLNIEHKIPGYAFKTIDRIASISGKERHEPHYEQLLQVCGEIYVINQAAHFFREENCKFIFEPTCGDSNMNPEFVIEFTDYCVGIEVKQPSLFNHIRKRGDNPFQISTRIPGFMETMQKEYGKGNVTLPRDNPVKDFFISANEKFKNFKSKDNFYSILFIVWDDFIYEPISAILGEPSGLLCADSFARDSDGKALTFDYIDAVILDRQLVQFISATRDEPLLYGKSHAMEYGTKETFPFKVIINNKSSKGIPDDIKNCFQVHEIDHSLGGEYMPSDFIIWYPFTGLSKGTEGSDKK